MIFKLLGIAAAEIVIYALLRRIRPEFAVLSEIAAAALVFFTVAGELGSVKAFFEETVNASGAGSGYAGILLKILGTALITQFAADAARDSGQSALAEKIEFAGKLLMLSLALPVLKAVLQLITSLSNGL